MNRSGWGWVYWGAGCLAVCLLVFLMPSAEVEKSRVVRPAERWSVPETPQKTDLLEQAGLVANSKLWGEKKNSDQPAEDTRWAIAGAYVSDGQGTVIVRFAANKPELLLRKGESLPGGEKIVSIEADRVCVQMGKKRECQAVIPSKPRDF